MNTALAALAAAFALAATGPCDEPFHWEGDGGVAVFPAATARIDLAASEASGPPLEGATLPGRLVLDVGADGLAGGRGAWTPAQPRLSLTPPGVPLSVEQPELRIDFGDGRRPLVVRRPRSDFFPGPEGRGYYQAWADSSRLGTGAFGRFRRSGRLTVELWARDGGGPLRRTSSAQFDWADVEALARRARDHYAACPAA